jgi:hypothetical protein
MSDATRAALAALALVLAVGGCGGNGDDEPGRELYREYRAAEDDRHEHETALTQAFRDLAVATERKDRAAALAAVASGEEAADAIEAVLARELQTAGTMRERKELSSEARRLERGLEKSREALGLIRKQLAIAQRDPFLERRGNAREVRSLAGRSADLSIEGELLVRRADRALARAVGVEPRSDPFLEDEERGAVGRAGS